MDEARLRRLQPPPGGSGIQPARLDGDRVNVQVSRKVNLGKYDMLEVGCGATVSVLPGETLAEAIRRVAADVKAEHADLLAALREEAVV